MPRRASGCRTVAVSAWFAYNNSLASHYAALSAAERENHAREVEMTSTTAAIGNTKPPDEQVFLQAMYKEQCDQARQHEALRQQSTTLIFALSGTIAALGAAAIGMSTGKEAVIGPGLRSMLVLYAALGIFVTALGWFGRQLSVKHYERNKMHVEHARAYRRELEGMFSSTKYRELRKTALERHKSRWNEEEGRRAKKVYESRAFIYWMDMYFFLMGLGIAMIVVPIAFAIRAVAG
jgi:hypothetical protein